MLVTCTDIVDLLLVFKFLDLILHLRYKMLYDVVTDFIEISLLIFSNRHSLFGILMK